MSTVLVVGLLGGERGGSQAAVVNLFATIGLFLVAYALPFTAIAVATMEHDGRLDQLRLAGRTTAALAGGALTGLGGPLALAGLVAMGASAISTARLPYGSIEALLTVTLTWASSIIVLALPRAGRPLDSRLLTLGAAFLTYMLVRTVGNPFDGPGFTAPRWAAAALLLLAVVAAACLPRVVARFRRPPAAPAGPGASTFAPALTRRLDPIAKRGVFLMLTPALGTGSATLGAVVLLVIARGPEWWNTPLVYAPLMIGAIAMSFAAREDAESGRLEVIRLGANRLAADVWQMAGGWIAFVIATAVLILVSSSWARTWPRGALMVAAALAVAIPLSVAEGWHRRIAGVYVMPLAVFPFVFAARQGLTFRMAPAPLQPWVISSWIAFAALAFLAWRVGLTAMRRPEMTLQFRERVLAVTVLVWVALVPAVIVGMSDGRVADFFGLVLMLTVAGGWLAGRGERRAFLNRVVLSGLAGVLTLALVSASREPYGVSPVMAGAIPAAILWASLRVHEELAASTPLSVGLRLALFLLPVQYLGGAIATQTFGPPALFERGAWAALALAAGVEIVLGIVRVRVRRTYAGRLASP